MTGPSLPSSSSSSKSGQCPTGPQAWAKPTPWAPWVRAGQGRAAGSREWGRESTQICLLHSFLCALLPWSVLPSWCGDMRASGYTQELLQAGAENDLPLIWNGLGSPWKPSSSVSGQIILVEGKLSARHLGADKRVIPLLAPLGCPDEA